MLSILYEDIPNIDEWEIDEVDNILSRLLGHEPIQYITGLAPFYGHLFEVDRHVLIPRPETEELVYAVEKFIRKHGYIQPRIIDIGTGSGCIPITLSSLFVQAKILGVDISEAALELALKNNRKMSAEVNFHCIDFLDKDQWIALGDFDIIVSNPPYIPDSEKSLMAANVLDYEPHLALFVEDQDPLIFYNKIFQFAQTQSGNIAIFLECNEYNAMDVESIFSTSYRTEIIKDMQGKNRILKAFRVED